MCIYLPPSLRHFDPRRIVFSAWMDHLSFGYDIVEALKPSLLVELGTYQGLSYFTFCQSVKEHDLNTICYAVDTWEGDEHVDSYDESIFKAVSQHNREHYYGFSYLLQMYFDEAIKHFNNETVDLLHIDGCHTYESINNDFHNWFSKVKPGGIIILHDICARMKDFGVWKFWEEQSPKYETFEFKHGFGLGIIRKQGGVKKNDLLLKLMFNSTEKEKNELRAFYIHASRFQTLKQKVGPGKFIVDKTKLNLKRVQAL